MIIKVRYSKQAKKFLEKNISAITEKEVSDLAVLAVKRIFNLEDININLKALKGNLKGYYRIRTGNIRIIFNIENHKDQQKIFVIFFTKEIDFRGNVYD